MTDMQQADSIQSGLKIIVERAVRPVAATLPRKKRMREELLAHVTAVFEEERERLGDDAAALAATAVRFGDPRDVATQLQSAIPAYDRPFYLVERLTNPKPEESLAKRSGWWAMLITSLNTFMVALGTIHVALFAHDRYRILSMLWLLLAMAVGSAVLTYLFVLLTHSMRMALFQSTGRNPGRAIWSALLACLAPIATVFCLYLAISGDVTASLTLMPRSALFVPLVPGVIILAAWQIELDRRYLREWAELEID